MRSFLPQRSSGRLATLVVWVAGVALLTPLILVAGLLAVAVLAALTLSRRAGRLAPTRRRAAPAPPPVLRLEPPLPEGGLRAVGRRAA